MIRCDYDAVFYRVFCVTLLAVAFTFTIILANVFIDIDGLLSKKDKAEKPTTITERHINKMNTPQEDDESESVYNNDDNNIDEVDDTTFRTKRSLESQNFLFHLKDSKMKTVLTNRLATLLEELDEEESVNTNKNIVDHSTVFNKIKTEGDVENFAERTKINDNEIIKRVYKDKTKVNEDSEAEEKNSNDKVKDKDDLLHLTMHNILLQGILGHMDLNEVYKKVHGLVDKDTYEETRIANEKHLKLNQGENTKQASTVLKNVRQNAMSEENKFFEELVKCKKLQKEITQETEKNMKNFKNSIRTKEPKLLIKATIDISSPNNRGNTDHDRISKDDIKGVINLSYNGELIKLTRIKDDDKIANQNIKQSMFTVPTESINNEYSTIDSKLDTSDDFNGDYKKPHISNNFLNKALEEYFKNNPTKFVNKKYSDMSLETRENYNRNRSKRHIKIKLDHDDTETQRIKPKRINSGLTKNDDELYVEIETHFDNKGMHGEKKKKLIRSLIDKIKKAIHSDIQIENEKIKKQNHVHVKKRVQDPIDYKNHSVFINRILIPYDAATTRDMDPIGKSISLSNTAPNVSDRYGNSWKKEYFGPSFFTASKSINSAEMGEVEVDYNKVLKMNGIPQRLQKPLNTDSSDELLNSNTYFDFGNLKFFIKDIEGTGFSIGFNQYVDEPPDQESLKLFSNIENLVKTYHKNYDENSAIEANNPHKEEHFENEHELTKRDTKSLKTINEKHFLKRNSINDSNGDYHSNEYKMIYDNNFLSYDNYPEIYGNRKKPSMSYHNKSVNNKDITEISDEFSILDDTIFDRNLKPAEIFGLANLIDRKKRAISVKRISNLKNKVKLNKYLNTKAMATKTIYLKNKRNKRQVDKIRIIATDNLPNLPTNSEEKIFVVSDENVFADRAIIREVEIPDAVESKDKIIDDHYDFIPSFIYGPKTEPNYFHHPFDGKSRHNALMSKYPHVFLDEISKSKEEEIEPEKSLIFSKIISNDEIKTENSDVSKIKLDRNTENSVNSITDIPVPKVQEIIDALSPRTNYKLTVKVLPKNGSDLHSGFKEVHTSINKSFNKNGLLYSSLVNVSEISKVEKLNKTNKSLHLNFTTTQSPLAKQIKEEQEKMKRLLEQHKNRINQQLQHLKNEKRKLESVAPKIEAPDQSNDEMIDFILPFNQPQVLRMNKGEVSKLLSLTLLKLQDTTWFTNGLTSTTVTPTTTVITTPEPVVLTTVTPKPIDVDKIRMLKAIKRNENLTNEILHRIEKNSEILQTFLQKITEKIVTTTTETNEQNTMVIGNPNNFNDNKPMFELKIPNNWNRNFQSIHEPFFSKTMPNLETHQNNTHISIPFVYAYQQPYVLPNKEANPVASVVYHGHIHTNAIHKNSKPVETWRKESTNELKPKSTVNKVETPINQTKFFIDELENDYKIVSANDVKKNEITIQPTKINKILNETLV